MHESLSVADVMRREYVGVNEGDTVAGAAALMHGEGVECAIVVRGPDPVGMLTASDVVGVLARGEDPDTTEVDAAMRRPVITVDPDDDLGEAIGAIADGDVGWLVVVSEGELVGLVTEHDIVTAPTALSRVGSPEADPQQPVDRPPGVGLQSATYSTQGVCEVCGALSRALDSHNGQLVCEDCRAM
jgi:CBS domain-containing protein